MTVTLLSQDVLKISKMEQPSMEAFVLLLFVRQWAVEDIEQAKDEDFLEVCHGLAEEIRLMKDNPGWIPAWGERIEDKLGFSLSKQCRLFNQLKSAKLIEVRKIGLPASRWIKIIGGKK